MSATSLAAQTMLDALTGWKEVEDQIPVDDSRRRFNNCHLIFDKYYWDEDLLLRAGRHPRPVYRIVAVEYGRHYVSVVSQALRDPYWRVRWTAAHSEVAPAELLAELVHDPSLEVRSTAAVHPHMPLAALEALLADRESTVRESAARNESLSQAHLCRLADHDDAAVRRVVARRVTDAAVLEQLACDPDLSVAEAVVHNGAATGRALHSVASRCVGVLTTRCLAAHPNTAFEDLRAIIDTGDVWSLEAMASKSTNRGALDLLIRSDLRGLRAAIIANPHVTGSTLELVPLTASVTEHRAVVEHPHATWSTCRRLAEHYLQSKHGGRRHIGVEFVRQGLTKEGAPSQPHPGDLCTPVDVLVAWLTRTRTSDLRRWAQGTEGPEWLRTMVAAQLDRVDVTPAPPARVCPA